MRGLPSLLQENTRTASISLGIREQGLIRYNAQDESLDGQGTGTKAALAFEADLKLRVFHC